MSTYLSQFVTKIPIIGGNEPKSDYLKTVQGKTPVLKYICIFNEDYISGKGELNEELSEQIFCFISDNDDGDSLESNKVEQIRTIGLIQALEGLSNDFGNGTSKEDSAKIINLDKSTVIVKNLEGSFKLACSISMPENSIKQSAINHQMIQLLTTSYNFFGLLNTSFSNIINNYNSAILKNLMKEHWLSFFRGYNSENFKFPPTVKWPNSLNYKGFLGFFNDAPNNDDNKVFKKSSIDVDYNLKYEMEQVFKSQAQEESSMPVGLVISCFNKDIPKKYGLIFHDAFHDESINDTAILKASLIDVYNFLEYYDYHEKLTTGDLIKLSNADLFSSSVSMQEHFKAQLDEQDEDHDQSDAESNIFRDSANYAKYVLNPINLTNNLVIQPINYSMNSMMNMSLPSEPSSWLTIPSYFKFLKVPEVQQEDSNEEEEDKPGSFLIGLVQKEENEIIERKLVYLPTKVKGPDGNIIHEEREYLLIVYSKNGVFLSLIYDSSVAGLDSPQFYKELSSNVCEHIFESLEEHIQTGAEILEASVGSLPKSMNELSVNEKVDSDFFFVVYDEKEKSLKTSLPYLPLPVSSEEIKQIEKPNLNIRSAMFYLHDQLLDLFFLQKAEFFKGNSPNEFFHKFSTNKINDWMFYYVHYEEKNVIIIKNMNHNFKKKKHHFATARSGSSIASENYLKLDFLDNLGDEVKVWFESLIIHGTT